MKDEALFLFILPPSSFILAFAPPLASSDMFAHVPARKNGRTQNQFVGNTGTYVVLVVTLTPPIFSPSKSMESRDKNQVFSRVPLRLIESPKLPCSIFASG